ncbi:copper-translocating P-type ATPase [bacterium]|nr:copper-translocating P-type ATPase [bacterium]
MDNLEQKSFKIEGMHCASCSALIEKTLSKTKGVRSIAVNLAANSGKIEFDGSVISFPDIEKKVRGLGYRIVKEKKGDETKGYLTRFVIALLLSIPVALSMFYDTGNIPQPYSYLFHILILFLGAIVVLGTGSNFHIGFLSGLRKLRFNMDSLISIGSMTALIYSFAAFFTGKAFHHFLEGANFIVTFILLGKYLEARSKGKASEALLKLFELQAKKATVIRDDKETQVDIDSVKIDDVMIVKSGEKIPLDGIIIDGNANIDESMLTGESIPLFKEINSEVFAAAFVLDGVIKVRATKKSEETMFSQIVSMVEAAQGSKAPIQRLADKVAGIFVPGIMGISLFTFIVWHLISGRDIASSLLPAVAVLVIACPCALGLATPTAIMVASGAGAKLGIIIKDGEAFEKSSQITSVVFDKTGTLTNGKPEVTDVFPLSVEGKALLNHAASLAKNSNHPLSKAIYEMAKIGSEQTQNETLTMDIDHLENVKEISGKGIEGFEKKKGVLISMGNSRFMNEKTIVFDKGASEIIDRLSSEGKTLVFLAIGSKLAGVFGIMDMPKPDASKAIKDLKIMGKEVYMITGDNKKTANSIAMALGIDPENVIAECLPHEKADRIKELQKHGKKIAFLGDGINDAPAIAAADLGIAIGTGSDIAIETGNMILVKGNPSRLVTALKLSLKTYSIIKQNLFWAFFYNLIGVPLAAFGIMPPAFASLAMSLSSVSVVTNSLRIRKREGL